jgi:hypothetical protein
MTTINHEQVIIGKVIFEYDEWYSSDPNYIYNKVKGRLIKVIPNNSRKPKKLVIIGSVLSKFETFNKNKEISFLCVKEHGWLVVRDVLQSPD